MKEKYYFVYISTNQRHTVLYTGVTNNIFKRDNQHKEKIKKNSFTARYNVNKVVYYETFTDVRNAIAREKQIKGWLRKKKIDLINSLNSEWKDMVEESWK
ncbi:MAG: GIY-YIG nuclease superfamily protein [Parcubacteria group bacterium ADurb.Bin316]|nr:MAG: GIY-YIG nuclease superfamily protein [Parcubacteria group bacterium ADurb.Bin316]HOZ55815.1 GIY-YIG nuclease family protein [bacterium]